MTSLPNLLPGWTEHVGPQGHLFWYHEATQQSTYIRPTIAQPAGVSAQYGSMPMYTGPPPPSIPVPSQSLLPSGGSNGVSSTPKSKKEKPSKKESIPGTDGWKRVTTTFGNIFYAHAESKRSEWVVPDEIEEQVAAMEEEEKRVRLLEEEEQRLVMEKEEEEKRQAKEQARLQRMREEEEKRRKRQEELQQREEAVRRLKEERDRVQQERLRILQDQGKRKREEGEEGQDRPDRAAIASENDTDKRPRLGNEEEEEEEEGGEEAWQREMAAEMAAEAEQEEKQIGAPRANTDVDLTKEGVSLSLEEGKTVFMHMLTTLNGTIAEINPMAPWDRELPKFIHHRDYTVLSSLRDRQDAFNEWCKLRLREKRKSGKTQPASAAAKATYSVDILAAASSEATPPSGLVAQANYRKLLEDEVKSTRTKWEDFKKLWRKDRQFFSYGRDDRDREKMFRIWLKELGEVKRNAAEEAERGFFALLDEKLEHGFKLEPGTATEEVHRTWSKAKRVSRLDQEPRYEAVGSSSRRAELFGDWAKGERRIEKEAVEASFTDTYNRQNDNNNGDAKERALMEREEAVQRKRQEIDVHNRRAYGQATRGESVANFQQLLIDALRDPLLSLSEGMRAISSDGRSDAPGLRTTEKEDLVQQHIDSLNERRLRQLHEIFERHAPSLDVEADIALPLIKDDDEVPRRRLDQLKVLHSGKKTINILFYEWREEQERQAAVAFKQMLQENAFVKFWGGLRREYDQRKRAAKDSAGGQERPTGRQGEDEDDDDEPDLLQMAGNVDLEEVHSILRNEQRYRAFRHRPQQREEWIRDHLQSMSVPKKTVFQRD